MTPSTSAQNEGLAERLDSDLIINSLVRISNGETVSEAAVNEINRACIIAFQARAPRASVDEYAMLAEFAENVADSVGFAGGHCGHDKGSFAKLTKGGWKGPLRAVLDRIHERNATLAQHRASVDALREALEVEAIAKAHYELARAAEPRWFGGTPVRSWDERAQDYRDECVRIMRAALCTKAAPTVDTSAVRKKINQLWHIQGQPLPMFDKEIAGLVRFILEAAPERETEGWQLVPQEPTPEMLKQGSRGWLNVLDRSDVGKEAERYTNSVGRAYKAMLSAAPSPSAQAGKEME